jgi:hypothetical protein
MFTPYFTKAELTALPKFYTTEHIALENKQILVKLFHPGSSWTWYVIEYDGADLCWGLVDGHELEFGYFSLKEISTVTMPRVERDKYFKPCSVSEIMATVKVF